MKELAILKSIEGREAIVELESRGGCSRCGMNTFCHSTGQGHRELRVGLGGKTYKPGDVVEIETPARGILGASFLVFILPLILSFAVYGIVFSITKNTESGIVGFVGCFILTMGSVAWLNKFLGKRKVFRPLIVRKVNRITEA